VKDAGVGSHVEAAFIDFGPVMPVTFLEAHEVEGRGDAIHFAGDEGWGGGGDAAHNQNGSGASVVFGLSFAYCSVSHFSSLSQ